MVGQRVDQAELSDDGSSVIETDRSCVYLRQGPPGHSQVTVCSRSKDESCYTPNRAKLLLSAIEVEHPVVQEWEYGLEGQVMELIRPSESWVSVDVLRAGYIISDRSKNPPAILVTAASKATALADVEVIVRDGRLSLLANHGREARMALKMPYEKRARPGYSIRQENSGKVGTLGGYIQLTKAGKTTVVGLTSHNALRGPEYLSILPGAGFNIEVLAPAFTDHQDDIDSFESLEITDDCIEQEKSRRASYPHDIQRKLEALKKDHNWRDIISGSLLRSSSRPSVGFGKVFATSGIHGTLNFQCLDWGLIEVDAERQGSNEIILGDQKPVAVHDTHVSEMTTLEPGSTVFSCSRTLTKGILNAVPSHIRLPGNPAEFKQRCFVGERFARPGYSGAWILSDRLQLGALILAGDASGQVTYGTDVKQIFHDIKETFGYRVSLPH
ncbi:MAG: hypothetical protein M1819_000423 [Sarea resinae]|nr:MAG: hypothetical protein M1819_000423 [Sarea resinae]